MLKSLPMGAIIAQQKARSHPELKELLYQTLKELSLLNDDEKINYARKKIDSFLSKQTDKTSCSKGCAYCCHHQIHLSQAESKSLPKLSNSQAQKHMIQKDHIQKQKDWSDLDYEYRACIFLGEDNTCTQYENRPLVCRITQVDSQPLNCKIENEKEISPVFNEKANIIVLAYYTLVENFPMPEII